MKISKIKVFCTPHNTIFIQTNSQNENYGFLFFSNKFTYTYGHFNNLSHDEIIKSTEIDANVVSTDMIDQAITNCSHNISEYEVRLDRSTEIKYKESHISKINQFKGLKEELSLFKDSMKDKGHNLNIYKKTIEINNRILVQKKKISYIKNIDGIKYLLTIGNQHEIIFLSKIDYETIIKEIN